VAGSRVMFGSRRRLTAQRLLVSLEVRQLSFQGAEPVNDRADRQVVKWGNGRDCCQRPSRAQPPRPSQKRPGRTSGLRSSL
jgi:hypothetical protein